MAPKSYESGGMAYAVLEVGVTVDKVEGIRLSDKANEDLKSNYKLNVTVTEKQRSPGELIVIFVLELTGQPQLAKITVSGTAKLTGPDDEIQDRITKADDKTPPKVVETIYERVYGLVYVLAGGLKVPYPMPNILKKGVQDGQPVNPGQTG